LAEQFVKLKEKINDYESKLEFQSKSLNKIEDENKWMKQELEKVKLEYKDYKIKTDKKLNDLEIHNDKIQLENDALLKDNNNLKNKYENQKKEIKKLEDNKLKVSKFVNEVIGINEALVNKVQLLQEKERSKLKDKDTSIKNLMNKSSLSQKRSEFNSPQRNKLSNKNNSNNSSNKQI